MKASPKEMEIHLAIKSRSDIALSKLNYWYGPQITRILKFKYQKAAKRDEANILEAVNEAFFGYYRNPDTFSPVKSTLLSFLIVAAERDLQNILGNKTSRETNRKKDLPEDVELQEKFWNSIITADSSADNTIQNIEIMETIQHLLEGLFPKNEKDVVLAWMVLSSERETQAYSEVLEIECLTILEQRAEVKKQKDRIKKVLERHHVEDTIKILIQ